MIRDLRGWPCAFVGRDDLPTDGIVLVEVTGPDGAVWREWRFAHQFVADGGPTQIGLAILAAPVVHHRRDVPTFDPGYDACVCRLLRSFGR